MANRIQRIAAFECKPLTKLEIPLIQPEVSKRFCLRILNTETQRHRDTEIAETQRSQWKMSYAFSVTSVPLYFFSSVRTLGKMPPKTHFYHNTKVIKASDKTDYELHGTRERPGLI